MRSTSRSLAAGLLAAALVATACGTDSDATADPDAAASTGEDGPSAAEGDVAADIKDFVFVPMELEVAAGTTVTWTNQDRFGHTVTAGTSREPTGEFDLTLGLTTDADTSGETGTYTFDEPGTYAYFCRYHPSMQGTVTVTG